MSPCERKPYHNARLAAVLTACVLLLTAARADARVIEVGPTRAIRTIDAALTRAGVGDEIVLDRGGAYPTAGLRVATDAIEIRSAEGAAPPAVIRNTSTQQWAVTIDHRAEGLMIRNVVFDGGPNVTCVRARGRRLTIDDAPPTGNVWRWVQISGATQTTLLNTEVPAISSYSICSFDHDARGLIVSGCTFAGASTESHVIRLQRMHAATLRACTIRGSGARTALSLRDGADNRVEDCTIDGAVIIGPLADGDGGINMPTATEEQRRKREEVLRYAARNYTLRSCTITTGGITVEMGVESLTFDRCRIKTTRDWALRLNRDEYEPWRCVPTGRLIDCELTGAPGLRVFEKARPDFHVFGTTANGERVPDSAPRGGAVPGEIAPAPTTSPTTSPATSRATSPTTASALPRVLRFDLIDAASGDVIRELTDGDELPAAAAAAPGGVNVRVTTDPERVGSVVVTHNGVRRVERTAPYTVGSPSLAIEIGANVVEAIPYAGDNATGQAGSPARITFTRAATQPSPVAPRREDVIAALAALDVARERLQASTRPIDASP